MIKKIDKNFLEGPQITQLVSRARQIKESKKQFSDIYDKEGNQYVDLVQEGGGVLGIALVGYTYILEQAGVRFHSLAGTSAGAINTIFMAGLAEIGEPVSVKILNILSDKNLFDFVDGPKGIKRLIQRKIDGKGGLIWSLIWNSITIYSQLKNHLGLNPGEKLENWIGQHLYKGGITTYADLESKRKKTPILYHRQNSVIPEAKLAIITSEVTTHTKVDFPRMAKLYWNDIEKIKPSEFVRASIAIPYFYFPFVKKNIPSNGSSNHPDWQKYAGYKGAVPPEVKFVDGGLLSNFPINIFHQKKIPSKPTFGVRLSVYREDYSKTSGFFSLGGAMISTMRQIYDYDFLMKNPDYKQLICHIDADKKFNWLNFDIKFEDQKKLFVMGAQKGLEFLEKFDWEAYKSKRKDLLNI
ncbi:patatin-like phospholipase family protein [Mesonia sp. K4-1]|uniref:patatin-like phospholipase family protein n=1 Tax=Mesonia sp. K4-1 TaxID=2602760 RepID=UPI0011C8FC9F|nr:patatin-like phospholipase family protein [Mesonia sp. K4-1]TXK74411.1 alpha/beta hydrolase [Mesonia sp. K4-1]